MKRALLVITITLFGLFLHAQTNLDSLWGVWNDETLADTCRLEAIQRLIRDEYMQENIDSALILAELQYDFAGLTDSKKYMGKSLLTKGEYWNLKGDQSKALIYLNQSLKIREKTNDRKGVAFCQNSIGNVYKFLGNYSKALNKFKLALLIYEEQHDRYNIAMVYNDLGSVYNYQSDYINAFKCFNYSIELFNDLGQESITAAILNNIGNIYFNQGDYVKAIDYYSRCIIINEKNNAKRWVATNLNNIGLIYNAIGDYDKALEYYNQSLKIREELNDKRVMAKLYKSIGISYRKQKDYSKALDYFDHGLEFCEELNDKVVKASIVLNIGILYSEKEDLPNALNYYKQSLEFYEDLNLKSPLANNLNLIGFVYLKKNLEEEAIRFCKKSFDLSRDLRSIKNQKQACDCLYEAYKSLGKAKEALDYFEQAQMLDDSLKEEETARKLQQMEFAKELLADSLSKEEEKLIVQHTHEMEVSKKEKQRNLFLGSGLLVLVIAVSLFSRLHYVRMSRALIQKERDSSDNLLLNILPAEIADELKEKGSADARDYDMVSILFTDFKGFTQASSNLSAQELVSEINSCFKAFDQIIGKYGIEKIKTIGDAYMAAGGLPVPTNESVKNIVLAALEMQEFIIQRHKEMKAQNKPAFEMRAGIHTGPVVAGIVGVKKFQYDIWGNTVNIASRMESNGEVEKVNISQKTYDLIKDEKDLTFEKRGPIEVKGKGMMEMYYVGLLIFES